MIRLLVILIGIFQVFHSSQSGTSATSITSTPKVDPIQERIEYLSKELGLPEWKIRKFLREVEATGSK